MRYLSCPDRYHNMVHNHTYIHSIIKILTYIKNMYWYCTYNGPLIAYGRNREGSHRINSQHTLFKDPAPPRTTIRKWSPRRTYCSSSYQLSLLEAATHSPLTPPRRRSPVVIIAPSSAPPSPAPDGRHQFYLQTLTPPRFFLGQSVQTRPNSSLRHFA